MRPPTLLHRALAALLIVFIGHASIAGQTTGASIYDLESKWSDGTGHRVKLSALGGKVRVLAMGYTSCQYACPRIIADMRAIQRALPGEVADKVVFTFVSFDPKRDTPQHLRDFQKKSGLDAWTFLTGNEDDAVELSVALGIKFQKVNDTDFAHSNSIFVLAPDGRILHRQDSLGTAPAAAVKAVMKGIRKP